jgi:DNA invertase Pin-like site-specific DNA recombinase
MWRGMANVFVALFQMQPEIDGEKIADALAAKRREGVRLGRPRQIPTDVRERIVSERTVGGSLSAIARGLTDDAVPTVKEGATWRPNTVAAVLRQGEVAA